MSPSANKRFTKSEGTEPLISEIMSLLSKITDKFEPENLGMRQWIIQHFNDPKIAQLLQESTLMMLRVLDAIGQLEPVNGITVSKKFRIPKGSVSKATRRLAAKKLIKTDSLPNNKKEILYRTTQLGKQLYEAHRAFDEQMEKEFTRFLNRYNRDELNFIVQVLQDFWNEPFLGLESRSKN